MNTNPRTGVAMGFPTVEPAVGTVSRPVIIMHSVHYHTRTSQEPGDAGVTVIAILQRGHQSTILRHQPEVIQPARCRGPQIL